MSRYSDQQLQSMARLVQAARQQGDPRYQQLVVAVARRVGTSATHIVRTIEAAAR